MHIQYPGFANITGITPQLPCIVSSDIDSGNPSLYADNTFSPKIAYYKGVTSGVGGWKYTKQDGTANVYKSLPFLFAVNYNYGGESDPVLSYSDQLINGKVARGLMSTYYLPLLAIMRYGRKLDTYIKLNNTDMANSLHRENILIGNIIYQYIGVDGYNPAGDDSCKVSLWKIRHPENTDLDNIRPTSDCVLQSKVSSQYLDFLYWPHLVLPSDVIVRNS